MLTIAYLAQGKIRVKTGNEPPRTIDSVFGNSIREKAVRAQQKHSWKAAGNDGSPFSGAVLWGKAAMGSDIPLAITSICGGREPGGLVYSLESGSLCALLEVARLGAEERRVWNDNRTRIRHVSVSRPYGNMVFVYGLHGAFRGGFIQLRRLTDVGPDAVGGDAPLHVIS